MGVHVMLTSLASKQSPGETFSVLHYSFEIPSGLCQRFPIDTVDNSKKPRYRFTIVRIFRRSEMVMDLGLLVVRRVNDDVREPGGLS
jgi:hypothetical protein